MDWNKIYDEYEAELKASQPVRQPLSPAAQAVNRRIERTIKPWMDASEVDKIANRVYSEDIDEEDPIVDSEQALPQQVLRDVVIRTRIAKSNDS